MGAHDSKSNDQKNTKTNNPMTTFPLDPVKPRGELFKTKVPEKGEYCSIKEEICEFGSVPFLMGLYEAYCFHCPIKFYPDDFWLLIVQMVSNYINDHSEKMRSKIVDFDGKKTLTALIHKVSLSSLTPDDYKSIIDQLVALIPKNIKDKKLVNTLSPTFSTSDSNNMYVKKLTVMCTFKKYFEYEAEICGCGFPSITLAGEVSDWELILKNLKSLIKLVPDLKSIKAPMEKIVETKKGNVDISFWKEMVKTKKEHVPYDLSGMTNYSLEDFITGWILKFFNYQSSSLNVREIDKTIPSQILDIPFTLIGEEGSIKMKFYSGFLGMKQDKTTREVSPVIGWYFKEDKNEDDERDFYHPIGENDVEIPELPKHKDNGCFGNCGGILNRENFVDVNV